MKVLFISSSRKGRGISPFVLSQGESLKELGIELEYLQIKGSGLINYLKSIPKIRNQTINGKFDINHAHFGFSGIISKLAIPRSKLVVSFLGDDLMGHVKPNGKYSKKSKILVFINRLFAKYCFDENIVKSQSLAYSFFDNTNYHIIPNGVDLSLFFPIEKVVARKSLGLNMDDKYFLFLGDPKRTVKNYRLFETSLKLGTAFKDYKVLTLTSIEMDKISLYYNAADICVLSSIHEGSPNVIKEAMACNSIVVSTRVGDVEWLFGNEDGYFIADSDPFSFANVLEKAVSYSNLAVLPNGRERIVNLGLDNVTIANKILDIYQSVYKS